MFVFHFFLRINMNVIIFAVCVNFAIVKADDNVIDFQEIIKLLLRGRRTDPLAKTNEPVETIPIMPGFSLAKPDGMSKSTFRYPTGLIKRSQDTDDIESRLDAQAYDLKNSYKKGNMIARILKAVIQINTKNEDANNPENDLVKPISEPLSVSLAKRTGRLKAAILRNSPTSKRYNNLDNLDIILDTAKSESISNSVETNEPVETIPIPPGFSLAKPGGLLQAALKYPVQKTNTVFNDLDKLDIIRDHDKIEHYSNFAETNEPVETIPVPSDFSPAKPDAMFKTALKFPSGSFIPGYGTIKDLERDTAKTEYNLNPAEGNGPIDTIPILPGFSLVKPDGISKAAFKFAKGRFKSGHDETKTGGYFGHKKEDLMARILKAAKNIDHNNERNNDYRYDTSEETESATDELADSSQESSETIVDYSTNSDTKNSRILARIMKAVQNIHENKGNNKHLRPPMILIQTKPSTVTKSTQTRNLEDLLNGKQPEVDEMENNASEIMDDDDDADDDYSDLDYRRQRRKKDDKVQKNRSAAYTSEQEEEASKSSSGQEKNPGNPFTIHKNKYKQNWLWNHYMDGDHMNINPFGPQFQNLGPSGPELFFGRKWWYFNQDDYKPMG